MTLEEIFTGKFTAAKWVALGRYLARVRIRGGVGIRTQQSVLGTVISAKRSALGIGGDGTASCAFAEVETWTEGEGEAAETKTGINGGIIYCGDQNWNILRHEIDVSVDGSWLLSIPINVIANRDDDNEIILPGIKTGTKPLDADWSQVSTATEGADYPDNEQPEVVDGAGKIYIPIGTITVASGVLSIAGAGCGNITVGQCGGVLSHTRG